MNLKSNISESLESIITMVKEKVDMDLWMFTRVLGKEWIIVAACENNYGVKSGDALLWNDSVCSRMIASKGPNVVPDLGREDLYTGAPIVKALPISSYLGFVLIDENNEVIGTLCGIDQNTKTDELRVQANSIQPLLRIAQSLIIQDDTIYRLQKAIEMMEVQTDIDGTTGLPNQDRFFGLAQEHKKQCDKLGTPIAIVIIEISGISLKGSGCDVTYEDLLRNLTADLSRVLGNTDILAKLDGSKFGVLMLNVENKSVSTMVMKISKHLEPYKLSISIGADLCKKDDLIAQSIERANSNRMI